MPKRYRSMSRAEARNATRSNFDLFKEAQEERRLRRLFGSTNCWKCDRPPTAQHNGTPYCGFMHHPDSMKRGES
jgi:hypothetical protein